MGILSKLLVVKRDREASSVPWARGMPKGKKKERERIITGKKHGETHKEKTENRRQGDS